VRLAEEPGPERVPHPRTHSFFLALNASDSQKWVGRRGKSGPGANEGSFVSTLDRRDLTVNRRDPLLTGLLAGGPFLKDQLLALVEPHIRVGGSAR
jgi:hypothetical protein